MGVPGLLRPHGACKMWPKVPDGYLLIRNTHEMAALDLRVC
jgi:hypothetical protein